MTTTIFRKHGNRYQMASDSRVSYIDDQGAVVKICDSDDYSKVAIIDGVLYGFAGSNVMYKTLLSNYDHLIENSDKVLDFLVVNAKNRKIQFSFLRFDGELKLFSYSPPDQNGENEIYLTSKDSAISSNVFAIGSGKYSKMYKRHKQSTEAKTPIFKIKSANNDALKKAELKELSQKIGQARFTKEESIKLSHACTQKGGDIFTGGKVRVMEKNTVDMTKDEAQKQAEVLDQLDQNAKSSNLVCASPIHAPTEIEQLRKLGLNPVSEHKVDITEDSELFESMSKMIDASL